jgi:hypothetical protein
MNSELILNRYIHARLANLRCLDPSCAFLGEEVVTGIVFEDKSETLLRIIRAG